MIVGNPPWSAGQRSAADDNPNASYPAIEARIAATYAERSTATLKNSLYDTYKMAIRWASDRIGDHGVVAFVTNGSWIDGNVNSGVRACLAEEFSSIHVVNLRGNLRIQGERSRPEGERSRREGGQVFGQASRTPVAITILVRNPQAQGDGCRILYRDIGDYLSCEDKLATVHDWASIAGIKDWQEIEPDRHHDWIKQRDPAFQHLYSMGTKNAKAGKVDDAIFRLFSNGYKTGRDAYLYNFSRNACANYAKRMVDAYLDALRIPNSDQQSSDIHWDDKLRRRLQRDETSEFRTNYLQLVAYRPFVKQHLYADDNFAQRPGRCRSIFPSPDSDNRTICVPGIGSTKPFSALVVDAMPDLHFVAFGQCFPRYRYAKPPNGAAELFHAAPSLQCIDNISDIALATFREHYADGAISKDAIFDYVYGVLHATDYRERFANDLAKDLLRIPMATDFHGFAAAGQALARLHLEYEACDEYPLETELKPENPQPEHFRIGTRAMRLRTEDKSTLIVNDHIRLSGIPAEAHRYVVNGRTPLEWFIDRYRITTDKRSGITNDPNGWFDDPRDLIAAIKRIVHVSVETIYIVETLPPALGA